ncbi:hypothetical protein BV898_00402 [Hypsibius exemplaris]|uniref:G-protein coupled receptors family 1 profile domain-containing protein n=1 Tax=Hypsibius exemplaris TaxID=2072580 RepID=A0A1W0XDP8_HYPEX|nr:hypothetical protein BV898_00402 [Hypsibius exemplaris]
MDLNLTAIRNSSWPVSFSPGNISKSFTNALNSPYLLTVLSPAYRQSWLIWLIFTLLTCLFGAIANVILLVVTIFYKKIRNSASSALIVHCTALDLYMSTVVAPVNSILAYLGPKQYLPYMFCRFFALGFYSFYYLHVWAGCCLAFQRFMATWFPIEFHRFTTRRSLAVMIALPWVLTMMMVLFPSLEIGTKTAASNYSGGCTLVDAGHGTSVFYTFTLYLPSAMIGVFYIMILGRTLMVLRGKVLLPANSKIAFALKRRLEISKTLFVSFLWFCVSMYPLTLAVTYFPRLFGTDLALHLITRYLVVSYSCLNPLFYFASSKLYMEGVRAMFGCGRNRVDLSRGRPRGNVSDVNSFTGTGAGNVVRFRLDPFTEQKTNNDV